MPISRLSDNVQMPREFAAQVREACLEQEFRWKEGYPLAALACGIVAVCCLLWFRRKKWM